MNKGEEKRSKHWRKWAEVRNKTEIAGLITKLEHQAEHDEKTGLYNERGWKRNLQFYSTLCDKYKEPISFLFVDLDKLKLINDVYGHETGDLAIGHVAEVIKKTIRESDIAARVGGDEFLICLPFTELTGAEILKERIKTDLKGPFTVNGGAKGTIGLQVSVSIGTSTKSAGEDVQITIERADKNMYLEKENKNNV
jgi:diguanylate cyclase (GGDEF)-like protein